MQIKHNISLKPYNTFGIDVPAEYYVVINDTDTLQEIANDNKLRVHRHALGGGSNILLTAPVNGLVMHNRLKGIAIDKEDENYVWLTVQAGEVWHDLVMHAIGNDWAGIENLALIPGTVGASPIQNIGAYGVEAKETIASVTCWHWNEKVFITYTPEQCRFAYRNSIFKHELKDKVFITSVTFRLTKHPVFNTSYGAITQQLEKMGVQELSIKAIADAVIAIRTSKLPDPKQIGNAGSFFKNPAIPAVQYQALQQAHPSIPSYPVSATMVKVPAGWLIEQCGWKGYKQGHTGVHERQALVLVNRGGADGSEVWDLSQQIVDSVQDRFNIELEREVQVW